MVARDDREQNTLEDGAAMEMAYRDRRKAEIAEMQRLLAGFEMTEECKWGKPTYTVGGKNVVILQGFKDYFGLAFFQGALLNDPNKVLVQLGQTHAGRLMKFISVKEIKAKASIIKAYVREAIAVGITSPRPSSPRRGWHESTRRCPRSSRADGFWRDARTKKCESH